MENEQLELFPQEEGQVKGSVDTNNRETIQDAEWCFQFFNNEPVVFGWSKEGMESTPLTMQISPVVNEGLVFINFHKQSYNYMSEKYFGRS